MKKALIALGALVGALVLVMYVGGALMSREHVASSTVVVPASPDSVWSAIRDFAGIPGWWRDLDRVERIEDPDGREVWRHRMSSGAIDIAVERSEAPTMLVTRILAEPDAAFGGIWTYQLAPVEGGTRVTVIEAGYINNKFFRFLAGTIFGLHGTLDSYLTDLATHFGGAATPEHVE